MRKQNIKYVKGTIIKGNVENKIHNNLLILDDVLEDSEEIICIALNEKTSKPDDTNIITIPNLEYITLPRFIHETVVDSIVQHIRARSYSDNYDEDSGLGQQKLIKNFEYASYRR